ncbi:unnamed protein product [Cuscuta epithymum]|uniref:Uncharacterized protein n=1 Tax=Cuscuta epithymum TaxID=186058 RepID=A0AAV0EUF1_9ASTE|nr:unnamed protein product [Cuscuta epithymum]
MAENGVCCAAMYLCLGVIAAVLGLVTAYQVKPERVTVTSETVTGHCFSLIVAIEVVLAIVALVGDQIVAPAIFAVNGPNGDGNARPNVAIAGGGCLLVLGFIYLKGQKCGTLVHFKILLAAGIVCFVRFFGVMLYYVIAILNQGSSNVSTSAPSLLRLPSSIVWF